MKRKLIYVGYKSNPLGMEVFRCDTEPTQKTHGHLYPAVVGPFKTVRAAQFMVKYGMMNPHVQCVADAERIATKHATKTGHP